MSEHRWFHAHVYFSLTEDGKNQAKSFWDLLKTHYDLPFVGALHGSVVGPHPLPQFEIHFTEDRLWEMVERLYQDRGILSVLVHPVSPNDLEDHFQDAIWLGTPLSLDATKLDPPGMNKAFARLKKNSLK